MRVLESYSRTILPFIQFTLDAQGSNTVKNETSNLCRYWDATRFAEYLYGCLADTIRRNLLEELGFLALFDQALAEVMNLVEMPDRRGSLLILQNRHAL